MPDLAELIESLPPDYQREALHYLQYLKERSERERQEILQRLDEAEQHREAGRVYSDGELVEYFEAKYGPLPRS